METRYEYDSRGMLKDLKTTTPSDSQSLYHCHYTYDGNGNRTKREGQGVETTYGYDSRNRLTQWEMEGYKGVSYEYDFNGNRIYKKEEEQETFYTYNRKNQLVSLQNNEKVLQFLYDNQGNLLGQESASKGNSSGLESANQGNASCDNRHYTYDALNRQTSITTGEGKIQRNLYDAEGMRYQKEEGSGDANKVIQLVYDRNKNLVSSSVNEKYLRVVGGSFPEALLQKGKQETTISYYGKDEQGSILHLTDEDGRIKNQYQYDAFGAILESKEEVDNPLTYTGQEYDEIPTQYYLRARYYNPLLGRFLQEDSYHGDGLNLYTYCQNNPVMYYDPSGYKSSDCKQDTSGRGDEDAVNESAGEINDDSVTVYRGTDRVAENMVYNETGLIMSDDAIRTYRETGDINKAYLHSQKTHEEWIKIWGDENTYVQAHGEFGTELSQSFGMDRSMISVSTDINTAINFAGKNGVVYEIQIPKAYLIPQTIKDAGESEYLIINGTKR